MEKTNRALPTHSMIGGLHKQIDGTKIMAKKDKKKTKGPVPVTPAMLKRIKKEASDEAVSLALVLMFTVLLDKYNAADYIQDVYNDFNKLAEEVIEGRVKLHELRTVIKEEYQIKI